MATRTDIHSPKNIDPSAYDFVSIDVKADDVYSAMENAEQAKIRMAHIARTGGKFSNHSHGGDCMICGANMIYAAVFHHPATNVYIRVGQDCAAKMEMDDDGINDLFKVARTEEAAKRKNKAGKLKAAATLKDKGLFDAVSAVFVDGNLGGKVAYSPALAIDAEKWVNNELSNSQARTVFSATRPYATMQDVISNLVRYGALSQAQWGLVEKLLKQLGSYEQYKAKVEEEAAKAQPAPTGRMMITGTILSIKHVDSMYGVTTKMLVAAKGDFKIWCTVPNAIYDDAAKGAVISMNVTLKPSSDDPTFAMGTRPAKATIIEAA
ncbi:hypothetical protein N9937_00080 [bacterium]|nr:hypothetical protein [bacterium]